MTQLLLTGASGFIGRNILPILAERFDVLAPSHAELDLFDAARTRDYLASCGAEVLVHCAVINPEAPGNADRSVYDAIVSDYERLTAHPFRKIVFIGSGAEYGKERDIVRDCEENLPYAKRPADEYGRAKLELTLRARRTTNAYNARIFGCYGPTEPERRFIRHAIDCCLRRQPITIRRDCRFSYVHVNDLGRAIVRLLTANPLCHDYNICGGEPHLLSEIAKLVRDRMGSASPVQLLSDGFANEYTGDDSRFRSEFPDFRFTPLARGIDTEIEWMTSQFQNRHD